MGMSVVNGALITSFSDFETPLDEYPKNLKGKALHQWIYRQVKKRKRISCWEIDADPRMCRTLMYLQRIGKLKFINEGMQYPYLKVEVVTK